MQHTLLTVSIALLAGLLMTRLFKPLKLPSVTAYLIAGILIGPYCIGRLGVDGFGFPNMETVHNLGLISDAALGFIAFSIGSEFKLSELKKTGKQAMVIGIVEALTAVLFADIALLAAHIMMPDILSLPQAITLGAIASATAPAATLMVVRQYKAKGALTNVLLPVVALDDAVCLIAFAVSFGIAKTIINGTVDVVSIIVTPLVEIAASLVLGAIMGWVLTKLEKMFNSNTNRLNMTIAFVFLTVSLSQIEFSVGPVNVGFSSLLVCMMLGTVFCNICPLSHDLMERANKWSSPLSALFFVISGAGLEFSIFAENILVVLVGVIYIISRSLGKYVGAGISAKATKCPPQVCKYLGITLLPQAGVALGMCSIAAAEMPDGGGELIRNVILFSVLIYELFGPVFTRQALLASGDIQPMSDEVKNRRHEKLKAAAETKNVKY